MVGLQQPQRLIQFPLRPRRIPLRRLACQEAFIPKRLEGGTKPFLGVAVGRCHIEVVDASVHCLGDVAGGISWGCVLDHDAAEADHRNLVLRTPIGTPGHRLGRSLAGLEGFPSGEVSGVEQRQEPGCG